MTKPDDAGATSTEYLGMSDDDFLGMSSPVEPASSEEDVVQEDENDDQNQVVEGDQEAASEDDESISDDAGDTTTSTEEVDTNVDGTSAEDTDNTDEASDTEDTETKDTSEDNPSGSEEKSPKEGDKTDAEPKTEKVNFEAFYHEVMKPFKANGRTIELKSTDEAIRLMQMGAGYGRKIQDLQPHLKVLRMLEKYDLLDESRLSYLIDINQKNPDAIKKLISDSGIDPLDLDINDNVSYVPKDRSVSDQEVTFHEILQEVNSHPEGEETLRTINQTWDQESKTALWQSPELLQVIQTQRELGIYDQITAEIDRQKTIGSIPPSTPFLQAYKLVGDHMHETRAFKPLANQESQIQPQHGSTHQPQVIATRTAAPKTIAKNGDKAAAAAPTKAVQSRKSAGRINPLEMADEDFLKQFEGRL